MSESSVSRRALLAGAAGGAAAALVPAAVARAAAPAATATAPKSAIEFFADPSLNYSALNPLGSAAYGVSDIGEVLTVFNRIHDRGDTYAAYCEEFLAMGRFLARRAADARRAGLKVTARDTYLRATTYLSEALFYVLATAGAGRAQEARVYREMAACFAGAAALFEPTFERVAIPYEGSSLPGWLLRPPGPRIRRPTLVLTNGSDGQDIGSFVQGGRAALDRGWNALIYDGPGQGSNLFLRGIPFRPDWETVVTPIVDWLHRQPGVDRRRIVLAGVSFAGYLVPRAAAYERRLAAVLIDPGVTNGFLAWQQLLSKGPLLGMLQRGEKAAFNAYWAQEARHFPAVARFDVAKRSEIYGNVSFYDKMALARRFQLSADTVRRIAAPTAICEAQEETFWPGQSATMYRWVRARRRRLLRFTIAEGAQFHCETMSPMYRNDVALDWLERNLEPTG